MTTEAKTPEVTPEKAEINIQREAGNLVGAEVYANVGALMEFCIKHVCDGHDDDNPISEDDLDFTIDTSSMDDEELNRYLDENFGESWDDVTGETWPKENTKEEIKAARSHITENSERQTRIDFGEGPVKDWDEETLCRFIEEQMGDSWSDIVGHRFPGTEIPEEETDQVKEYIREKADQREVYEWWAVSDWLGRKLKELGHIVIDLGQLTVWGREGTGQAILMDGDIQKITLELLKARGEL